MSDKQPEPATLDCEAAQWFVRWSDTAQPAGAKEQSGWFAWLQRSPKHIKTYFELDDMCERLGESAAVKNFDVETWMAGRRAPVISLANAAQERAPSAMPERPSQWKRFRFAAAAAVVVLGLAATFSWWLPKETSVHTTALGEQNTFTLADGSVVQLNTRSHVRVAFSDRERLIELEGEGLFTVAQDSTRPFLVKTRGVTVRALGTQFNVYDQGEAIRVSVVEGAVQVSSHKDAAAPLKLVAGEEAHVIAGSPAKAAQPNIPAAIAWRNHTLIFERAQLNAVAKEFNRYNTVQFEVDPAVGEANRLSGTFDARHPQSLLLWLQSRGDLKVTRQGETYRVEAID